MDTTPATNTKKATLLALTFVVSFCSFAYELVYSELLTVMYGGTVTQYSITIGLYFFALGVGAALSDDLDTSSYSNFFRLEVYLAVVAPAGFLLIVGLNGVTLPRGFPYEIEWVIARLPVLTVGLLSGFELPYLSNMVGDEEADSAGFVPTWVSLLLHRVYVGVLSVLGVLFHLDRDREQPRSALSLVLAMDYIGGLVGAVIYAQYLYPELGLVATVFVLALLNALAALVFVARFSSSWGWFDDTRTITTQESRTLLVVCLLLTAGYAGITANHAAVDNQVTEFYLEQQYSNDYARGAMDIEVTNQYRTQYSNIVRYTRTWTGNGENPYFNGSSEQCMRMGEAVQLCESWADSYHNGLVDVPMGMLSHSPTTNVLLIGGGDHIAVNYLSDYNVTVDRVDIDGEFMGRAADRPFYDQFNDDGEDYARLNTTVGDGFAYLQRTSKQYDLIILDVPGATDRKLRRLYSKEFYAEIRKHLTTQGMVVTWGYNPDGYPQHYKTYLNTVESAGLTAHMQYWAWEDTDGDADTEQVEMFHLFAPGTRHGEYPVQNSTAYISRHQARYQSVQWHQTPTFDGVEVNSIFDPNNDIII